MSYKNDIKNKIKLCVVCISIFIYISANKHQKVIKKNVKHHGCHKSIINESDFFATNAFFECTA